MPRTAGRERSLAAFRRREGEGLRELRDLGRSVGDPRRRRDRLAGGAPPPGQSGGRGVPWRTTSGRSTSTAGCSGCSTSSSRLRTRPRLRAGMGLGVMARSGGRGQSRRRRRVVAAGQLRPGHHGRRAAGPVQPERPELEPAAVAAGPAGRDRVRAVPPNGVDDAAALRRRPGRPHHRPVPAVVDPRRREADRGHLRPLRPRGADRHPGPGGAPRRCGGGGRGPRHRRAVGAGLPAERGILGTSILWFEFEYDRRGVRQRHWPRNAGASTAWRR